MGNKNTTTGNKSCPKCHHSLIDKVRPSYDVDDFIVCPFCNGCIHECVDNIGQGYSTGSILSCKKCLAYASRAIRKSN